MCRMASFLFNPKTLAVKVADLESHSNTAKILNLSDGPKPNGWREGHYLPTGEIVCNVLDVDSHTKSECESSIKAQWPSFIKFLNWAFTEKPVIDVLKKGGGGLDLSGLTSAKDLKLPTSIGGWLDLRGLTSAKDLKLPTSIGGGLDLSDSVRAELGKRK